MQILNLRICDDENEPFSEILRKIIITCVSYELLIQIVVVENLNIETF